MFGDQFIQTSHSSGQAAHIGEDGVGTISSVIAIFLVGQTQGDQFALFFLGDGFVPKSAADVAQAAVFEDTGGKFVVG